MRKAAVKPVESVVSVEESGVHDVKAECSLKAGVDVLFWHLHQNSVTIHVFHSASMESPRGPKFYCFTQVVLKITRRVHFYPSFRFGFHQGRPMGMEASVVVLW